MISQMECTAYLNTLLPDVEDYGPNGLQVEGKATIERLVTGVTACKALIEQAVALKADAVLVHHGLFWKRDAYPIVGMLAGRVRPLIQAGINLYAYHLPLDLHITLGNNAQLAEQLGFVVAGRFDCVKVDDLGFWAQLPQPMTVTALQTHVAKVLGRDVLLIEGGSAQIQKVAWCTGGAQDGIVEAAALGMDAYITGEASERSTHLARELGIHLLVAGHHATERYGVQAVGAHLAEHFGIHHQFVDVPNPV